MEYFGIRRADFQVVPTTPTARVSTQSVTQLITPIALFVTITTALQVSISIPINITITIVIKRPSKMDVAPWNI